MPERVNVAPCAARIKGRASFLKKPEFDTLARRKLYCAKSCGTLVGVARDRRKQTNGL